MRHALLQVVWTEMCVDSVRNHPIMIKIHPVSFFLKNLVKSNLLSQIKPFSDDVTQTQAPPMIVDWH